MKWVIFYNTGFWFFAVFLVEMCVRHLYETFLTNIILRKWAVIQQTYGKGGVNRGAGWVKTKCGWITKDWKCDELEHFEKVVFSRARKIRMNLKKAEIETIFVYFRAAYTESHTNVHLATLDFRHGQGNGVKRICWHLQMKYLIKGLTIICAANNNVGWVPGSV